MRPDVPSEAARPKSLLAPPEGVAPAVTAARGDRVEVGRVLSTRGRDGELLLGLYGEDPENVLAAERLRLDGDPGCLDFLVLAIEPVGAGRDRGARLAARLQGIDRPERARAWVGASISISEADLEPLPDGEYYWRDLLGLACLTLEGERLGVLEEIWPTGSNDVLVVRGSGRELLIPALRDVIRSVDRVAGEIRVVLPDGLREGSE
jgi:16S rRNA processing protein RimM